MKKGLLGALSRTASKRVKRLQAAAAQTADEFLERTYVGTAEQTLRGAATMTAILHEKDRDIAKTQSTIAKKARTKKAKKKSPRKLSKRPAPRAIRRKSGKR